jgi:membrane associated rhomboid family serine protease
VEEDNPPNSPSPRIESESKNQTPRTARDKSGKPVLHSKPVTVMAWSGEIEKAPWSSNESTAATMPRQTKSSSGHSNGRKQKKSGLLSDVFIKRITSSFFALVTLAHLGLLLATFGLDGWKASPMSVNPWYGGSAGTLARVGALALPLLESPAFQWWRLFSSPFVPAGAIHFGVAVVGLWTFGIYSRKALPLAYVSVPATYILSAAFGTLLSVNLNALYVVCGAWSGVAGLLGCVIIDQVLNWKRKKLLNLREWWLTAMILILCAASLLTFSALPMVGLWGTLGGLWTGLLFALLLLLIPRLMRKSKYPSRKRGYWMFLQGVSSFALVGSFITVIVGAALPNKLGETVPSLRYASCSTFGGTLWECTPFGFLASGCGVTMSTSGNGSSIACSLTADSTPIPSSPSGPALLMNGTAIQWLCERYCPSSTSPILPAQQPPPSPAVTSPGPLLIPAESLFPPTTSPSPTQSVSLIQTGRKLRAGTYAVY